ncbi:MAG TPA: HAMP domain-containing sensor histidine kinase, partial [Cellvibrionaceae bacterium]
MFKHSIRRRVIIQFAGFTLLISLIYAAASLIVAYITEDAVLDRLLDQEVSYLLQNYRTNGTLPQPRLSFIEVYHNDRPAPPFLLERITAQAEGGEIFAGAQHYHFRKVSIPNQPELLVIADVTRLLAVSTIGSDLIVLFIVALLLCIGLSVWAAWGIATRTTQPVLALARDVLEQCRHHQLQTLNRTTASNEIDYLQQTTQQALAQLSELINREQAFNRDLSHELRTPLTIIQNTLSLSETRPLNNNELTNLRQASLHIQQTVNALFALARAQTSELETFALVPLLEDCLIACSPALDKNNIEVALEVEDRQVTGNRHLAGLAIKNLINNAAHHGSGHPLSIRS